MYIHCTCNFFFSISFYFSSFFLSFFKGEREREREREREIGQNNAIQNQKHDMVPYYFSFQKYF